MRLTFTEIQWIVKIKYRIISYGADPGGGGGAHLAPPPPPKIGENMIFWRKIVIFHTK